VAVLIDGKTEPMATPRMSGKSSVGQQLRCLFDRGYRRAYRGLRHLPRIRYSTVIDAGANRGSFTAAFLQLHQPQRLVLVEALPELAAKLKQRFAGQPGITIALR
jgi:hypothetical protein